MSVLRRSATVMTDSFSASVALAWMRIPCDNFQELKDQWLPSAEGCLMMYIHAAHHLA